MKKVIFHFRDENSDKDYRIENLKCTDEEFMDFLDPDGESSIYSDLEEIYGIHDYDGSEYDNEIFVGFTSYEISRKNFPKVMEIWRKMLIDAGFIDVNEKIQIVKQN